MIEQNVPGAAAVPAGPAPLLGRTLGDFVVREHLGAGGFGEVYLATQALLGREVVIKTLRNRGTESRENVQRFLREAQLASKLQHPCAAHVYAFGVETDGTLWLAMELVRGTPLDQWLEREGPIPLHRFVPLWQRICEVVHSAHEQGIVHRDIKAANVMVVSHSGRSWPKLLDFGIARWSGADPAAGAASGEPTADPEGPAQALAKLDTGSLMAALESAGTGSVTLAGAVVGSPHYMAPEQWINPSATDASADIYALGILAFQCLSGRLPFVGSTIRALAKAHGQKPLPPLPEELPAALNAVLARATAKQPTQRYTSALELGQAIEAASGLNREPPVLEGLDEDVRVEVIALAPQPIADAMSSLESARGVTNAVGALQMLVEATLRYLGLCALACRVRVGPGGARDEPDAAEQLRALRETGLNPLQWLKLARALCRPFADRREIYPIPELIPFLLGPQASLDLLLEELDRGADTFSSVRGFGLVSKVLRELSFLWRYELVVGSPGGPERWTGVGRRTRTPAAVMGKALEDGIPVLVDADGEVVVPLWPLARALTPSPGTPQELFALTGPGRHGAKLKAFTIGFERQDAELWSWYDAQFQTGWARASDASEATSSPYRGLSSFSAEDADNFFGREVETEEFANRLRIQSFLVVVGPSGTGKSSFVQAGVMPALEPGWTMVVVRPGAKPLTSLVGALRQRGLMLGTAAALASNPGLLGEELRRHSGKILLLVDQFEELLTLCMDPAERQAYAEALVGAADQVPGLRIVATLRDDFLIRMQQLPPLRRRMAQAIQLLGTPEQGDLLRIVTAPASRAGYEFEDEAMPGEMVREVAQQAGALALLSFTASKLWELRDRHRAKLTRAAYASLGGVGGALAHHAEATIQEIPAEHQPLIREAFRALVTADGTRAVLSRSELSELLGGGASAQPVLETLIQARLLVASEAAGTFGDRIEIIHETLLASWPRLVRWQREDLENARLRDQLRAAARQWNERGRPKGVLWRKEALAEYRIWRTRYRGALTSVERDFGHASLREEARGIRIRRGLLAVALIALSMGLVVLYRAQRRAEHGEAQARSQVAKGHAEQGRILALEGRPLAGLTYLVRAAREGLWDASVRYLFARTVAELDSQIRVLHGPGGELSTLAVSPDRRWLASSGLDPRITIWEAETGKVSHVLAGHTGRVSRVTFSPDSRFLLSASMDQTARVWEVASGAETATLRLEATGAWATYSKDGELIATADHKGHIRTWDARSGKPLAFAQAQASARLVEFGTGRDVLAVAALRDREVPPQVTLLNPQSGKVLITLKGFEKPLTAFAFSPSGDRLAVASYDRAARVFGVPHGEPLLVLEGHEDWVLQVTWSPDGERIATASRDGTARIWSMRSSKAEQVLRGHSGAVTDVSFSADGLRVFTAGEDRTIRTWRASDGQPLDVFTASSQTITALVQTSDNTLASASSDGTVRIWKTQASELGSGVGAKIVAGFSSYDGQKIVVVDEKGAWIAWDLTANALSKRFQPVEPHSHGGLSPRLTMALNMTFHEANMVDLASGATLFRYQSPSQLTLGCFSWDEKQLALTQLDGRVILFELPSGAHHDLRTQGPSARACAFRPDGLELLVSDDSGSPEVWDLKSSSIRLRLLGHSLPPATARYSLDGRRIATGGSDGTVILWDSATGRILSRFDEHRGPVHTVAFSPNQLLLITGSGDSTVKIWDASQEDGRLLQSFQGLRDVAAVGFSSDSRRAFAATPSGFRHWDTSLEDRERIDAVEQTEPRLPFRLNAEDLLIPVTEVATKPIGQQEAVQR